MIGALYGKLDASITANDKNNEEGENEYAFDALLRCREEMGDQEFQRRSMRSNFAERERFKQIEFRKNEAAASLAYGIVPQKTMDMIKDRQDRADGAMQLKRDLDGRRGNLQMLVPHMESFLEFLGTDLMTDPNPKVVLHGIECHDVVIAQAPSGTVRQHAKAIVANILRISLEAKPQIKAELYVIMRATMLRCGPQKIWYVFFRKTVEQLLYNLLALKMQQMKHYYSVRYSNDCGGGVIAYLIIGKAAIAPINL